MKTYKAPVSKGVFPYEYLTPETLYSPDLPRIKDFYSQLKGKKLLGIRVNKIHCVIEFQYSPIFQDFIDSRTQKRRGGHPDWQHLRSCPTQANWQLGIRLYSPQQGEVCPNSLC